MKAVKLVTDISRIAKKVGGKSLLFWKRNGGTVLTVAGVIGSPTAAVLSSMATSKAPARLEKHKEAIVDIHSNPDSETYRKDLAKAYISTGADMAKLYAPAAIVEGLSIFCLLKGHSIMRRDRAQAIAYGLAVTEAFEAYRGRVRDDAGEEKDIYYATGYKTEDQVIVNEETGEIVEEKVLVKADNDPSAISPYIFVFDERNPNFDPQDPEGNINFLIRYQRYLRDRVWARGWAVMRDILDPMNFDLDDCGSEILYHGWVRDRDHVTDISLGPVNDIYKDKTRPEWRVPMPLIIIFNCDGDIRGRFPDTRVDRNDEATIAHYIRLNAEENEAENVTDVEVFD